MCRACFVSWDAQLITTGNEVLDLDLFAGAGWDKANQLSVESFQPSLYSRLFPNSAAERTTHGTQPTQPSPSVVHTTAKQETASKIGEAVSTPDLNIPAPPGEGLTGTVVDAPSEYYVRLAVQYLGGYYRPQRDIAQIHSYQSSPLCRIWQRRGNWKTRKRL